MMWISLLITIVVGSALALVWWYRLRMAVEAARPDGIYERIARLLERRAHSMENVCAALEREADTEFRIALDEHDRICTIVGGRLRGEGCRGSRDREGISMWQSLQITIMFSGAKTSSEPMPVMLHGMMW
jgi:hypothetical protein